MRNMTGLLQDVRYALRQVHKSPGCALVAVATLALGIGANTAVFTVMDAVLLRTLPVRDPHRLYYLQIAAAISLRARGIQEIIILLFRNPFSKRCARGHEIFEDLIAYLQLGIDKIDVRYGDTRGSIGVEPMVALRCE
jgi:hypothetical protein